MVGIGLPELLVIAVLFVFYLIPIVAVVWALVTLQRIRSGQEVIRLRLEQLERAVQRNAGQ